MSRSTLKWKQNPMNLPKSILRGLETWVKFFAEDFSIILLGVILVIFLFYADNINPSSEILVVAIGIISTIIGIALPIVIGNVSDKLIPFNSKIIASSFKREPCYVLMLIFLPILAIFIIVYVFFDVSHNKYSRTIEILTICGTLFSIYVFYKFIKRAVEYSINTDDVVYQMCKKRTEAVQYDRTNYEKYIDDLELCSCIFQKKIKSDNFNDFENVSVLARDITINMLISLKFDVISGKVELRKLLGKYYGIIFSAWCNCFRQSPESAWILTRDYQLVVEKAIKTKLPFDTIEPLFFLYQRIAKTISEDEFRGIPYMLESPWYWYFEIVFKNSFDIDFLQRVNMHMFTIMKNVIDSDCFSVFQSFIRQCIEGLYSVSPNSYPYRVSDENYQTMSNIEKKAYNAYTLEAYCEVVDLIEKLDENEYDKVEIRNLLNKQYKYNQLQELVALMASYCYFLRIDKYVQCVLQYNQPNGSSIIYGNRDIVPDKMTTVLMWYNSCHTITFSYLMLWPGHNDATTEFRKYLALMACRVSEKRDNIYRTSFEGIYDLKSKQQCESLEISIDNLKQMVEYLEHIEDFGLCDSLKDNVTKQLDIIKEEIVAKKEILIKEQKIDANKKNEFASSIVNSVQNNPIWVNALSCGCMKTSIESGHFDIEARKILPKSFLAKDDNGLYVEFGISFANVLVDQIDWRLEMKMRSFAKMSNRYEIRKEDFKQKILELDKNDVVVFINFFHSFSSFFGLEGFKFVSDGNVVGTTSNGTTIMSFGDTQVRTPRMFIFDKSEWAPLQIEFSEDNINVSDLNEDESLRENLVDQAIKNNSLLKREELDSSFKQCVYMVMNGKCKFKHVNSPNVYFIENI